MLARALIVAIESYPHSSGELAKTIAGAGQAGQDFAVWFVTNKLDGALQPDRIFACSDTGIFPAGVQRFGVNREEILDAVTALVGAGQDQTEELYVFFSGHGFTFQDSPDKPAVAQLVAADFVSAARSGAACLDLTELQRKLWANLGGKHHYYFIDACRNILNEDDIEPVSFGRKFGRAAQRGQPTRYTLYSTRFGKTADIQSPFAGALVEGLTGKGRAKGYTPDHELYVMFPLLKVYIESRMANQKVDDAKEGSGDGYILQIQPIPNYSCKVTIEGASALDKFRVRKAPAGQPDFGIDLPFDGPEFSFEYPPGDLAIDVLDKDGNPLQRVDPPAGQRLDFFDECSVRYRRAPAPAAAEEGGVAAFEPMPFDVRATNLQTADTVEFAAGDSVDLGAGVWEMARLDRGSAILKQTVHVTPDTAPILELHPPEDDPARRRIAELLGLSDLSNPDLGLWLTLLGAAALMVPEKFDSFASIGLDKSCGGVAPGASQICLLAGLRRFEGVALRSKEGWNTVQPIPGLQGVSQLVLPAEAGPQLLSLELDRSPVRTFTSWTLPDRATLIVLSESAGGKLALWQFMVPVAALVGRLPDMARSYLYGGVPSGPPLDPNRILPIVRTMYSFQNIFASNRTIAPPDDDEKQRWNDVLFAKWLDPLTSLIVCYDIIRRGDEELLSVARSIVLPNLRNYYPGIPDVAAIGERLVPGSAEQPAAPPLFTEGLFAFPDWPDRLPYPAARLDYGALWTTWRGVVEPA